MLYTITNEFTRISETAGTIQNNSRIFDVEVSDRAVAGSGILLYPLNSFTFSGTTLYLRCRSADGWAAINVVPFFINSCFSVNSDSSSASGDIVEDTWNGIYIPDDPDSQALIDAIWNDPIDAGDDFSQYLDGLLSG